MAMLQKSDGNFTKSRSPKNTRDKVRERRVRSRGCKVRVTKPNKVQRPAEYPARVRGYPVSKHKSTSKYMLKSIQAVLI